MGGGWRGRNFVVFDGASAAGSEGVLNSSPQMEVTFVGGPDPVLTMDTVNGAADLNFGLVGGSAPLSATRVLRFENEGPTESIEITSADFDVMDHFSITEIAVNGTGGQSLPLTLAVGDFIDLTVTASSPESLANAVAELSVVTDDMFQDQTLQATAAFYVDGSKMNPNAFMDNDLAGWGGGSAHVTPGMAAGSQGMARVKGTGDVDFNEPDSLFQATSIPDGAADWEFVAYFSPAAEGQFASYVDPDGFFGVTGPNGMFTDRTFQWVMMASDATMPNPDFTDVEAENSLINLAYMPDGITSGGTPDFYVFDGTSLSWVATGIGAIAGSVDHDADADPINGVGDGRLDTVSNPSDIINVYQLRVKGTGFGSVGASYEITVSKVSGPDSFTSGNSGAISVFHGMSGETNAPTGYAFTTGDTSFESNIGDGATPGFVTPFWVDDVCYIAGEQNDPSLSVLGVPMDVSHFGATGTSSTTAVIRNDGSSQNWTGNLSVSGNGFSIISSTSVNLAPGESQTIQIEFDASAVTPEVVNAATLTLTSNDAGEAVREYDFTGVATFCVNVGSAGVAFADGGTSDGVTAFGWVRSNDSTALKGGTTSFIGTTEGIQEFRGYVGFDLSFIFTRSGH